MSKFTDQLGNTITLEQTPKRIISLVPSQTELLFDLGLDEEVIGITKFCIHPESWFKTKTKVGGTKTISIDKVKELAPDLIIANKEENVKEQVTALRTIAPVWISDVNDLDGALAMIQSIGSMTGKAEKAEALVKRITDEFNKLSPVSRRLSTAYLIWNDPYMTVGGDTFINDMMQRCGLHNVFAGERRYPEATIEHLRATGCELLLLSSEPYPFKEKHAEDIRGRLPGCRVLLVDGEMFSWYGSRLLHAPGYFQQLFAASRALTSSKS